MYHLTLDSYKIGDTVTVTLNDVDLNTHSETIEVYTTSASTTEDLDGNAIFDRVGTVSADITNVAHGRLLDITFDDTVWSSYNCGVSPNGISDTGFTLSETNATSGIITGHGSTDSINLLYMQHTQLKQPLDKDPRTLIM